MKDLHLDIKEICEIDNELIYNLSIINSRGFGYLPLMTQVMGRPLIIHACALNHWDFVKLLLRFYYPNLWQLNYENHWTVLIYAILNNQTNVISLIIQIWNKILKNNNDWRTDLNTAKLCVFFLFFVCFCVVVSYLS